MWKLVSRPGLHCGLQCRVSQCLRGVLPSPEGKSQGRSLHPRAKVLLVSLHIVHKLCAGQMRGLHVRANRHMCSAGVAGSAGVAKGAYLLAG